jgi:DNA replication licensing factor MCM7
LFCAREGAALICAAAFEDFLKTYKTTSTDAVDALEDLNLDDDDLDDDYDFMDESSDETGRTRQRADPKLKYMRMLQQVADRTSSQVVIELDDVANVGS